MILSFLLPWWCGAIRAVLGQFSIQPTLNTSSKDPDRQTPLSIFGMKNVQSADEVPTSDYYYCRKGHTINRMRSNTPQISKYNSIWKAFAGRRSRDGWGSDNSDHCQCESCDESLTRTVLPVPSKKVHSTLPAFLMSYESGQDHNRQ